MSGSRAASALVVITSGLYFLGVPAADNDLWGHIFFGREILSAGSLPAVNTYSYTAPSHPWINHEILAECVFAAIFDRFGSPGLILLKVAIAFATLALMARTAARSGADSLACAASLVLGASLMSFGFMFRPQIFSFLALAFVWDRLHAYAAGSRRQIWWLPIVFAVWVNTHGGVLAGLAIVAVFAFVRSLEEHDRRARAELFAAAAFAALALLVNPYGLRLIAFLAHDVTIDRPIPEWAAIPLLDRSNLHFKFAVALYGVGLCLRQRWRPWEGLIVVLAAIAAFRHERHLPLFAIVAAPGLADTFSELARRLRRRFGAIELSRPAMALLAVGALAVSGFQLSSAIGLHRSLGLQIFVSPDQFPVDAVRFLKRNHLSGNVALPFDWGEYAIWHLHPDCRVSIDGRYTTAYPDAVIGDAWRFMEGSEGWDRTLQNASLALVDRRHGTAARLFRSPAWRYVYSDQTALLFVREGTPLPPTLDRRLRLEPEGAFFFP